MGDGMYETLAQNMDSATIPMIFINEDIFKMIWEYIDRALPLTQFEEMVVRGSPSDTQHAWVSHSYNLTEVCQYFYVHLMPTHISRRGLSLSYFHATSNHAQKRTRLHTDNLWDRLNHLCPSMFIPPCQLCPFPHYGGMLSQLHTIDMGSLFQGGKYLIPSPTAPWLDTNSTQTRALGYLQGYTNLRTLLLTLDNTDQVTLLGELVQLKNLDIAFADFFVGPIDLSPLHTLVDLQSLRLRSTVHMGLSEWLPKLPHLRVLETSDALQSFGSMAKCTSLRRCCVDDMYDKNETATDIIRRLIRVIRDLLTLPSNADVDIHLPIYPRLFGLVYSRRNLCLRLCDDLRNLMHRHGLGFRRLSKLYSRGQKVTIFYTFAPRRWPSLPNDIIDPHMVDQIVQRLCGFGACTRCRTEYWHFDCDDCLSYNVFQTPAADSRSKWEWERRVRQKTM